MRRSAAPSQRSSINSLLVSSTSPIRSNAEILALLAKRHLPKQGAEDSTSHVTGGSVTEGEHATTAAGGGDEECDRSVLLPFKKNIFFHRCGSEFYFGSQPTL